MADSSKGNLSKSLKEYLARNGNAEEKGLLKSVSIDSWFSKSNNSSFSDDSNNNGWFTAAENDALFPSLTKKQRIVGFIGFICMGVLCFILAAVYAPLIIVKARKFCLLYSMGSLFIIGSFSLLWGPCNHIKHLFSVERMPFTLVYFGTMFFTLYSAMWIKNTILTAVCAICQVVALIWYVVSYIPGGQTGLKFFSKVCASVVTKTASRALPV